MPPLLLALLLLSALCLSCANDIGKAAPTGGASMNLPAGTNLAASGSATSAATAVSSAATAAPTTTAAPTSTTPTAALNGPVTPTTIVASGVLTTRSFALADFVRISAHAFTVTVSPGAFSVSVTADDNVFDRLMVTVQGQQLILGLVPGTTLRNVTLRANVTLPEVAGLEALGAAHMTASGFSGSPSRTIRAAGASTISATMDSGPMQVDLSGASSGQFFGRCTDMRVSASGASHLEAMALNCASSTVDFSGASEGSVTATTVRGQVSGASHLDFGPETTTLGVRASGASSASSR